MDLHLSTSGPHSDDYTRELANGLSETVRVLSSATRTGDDGVTRPSTVYDVLGSLHAAAAGLDPMLRRLADQLAAQRASGRLRERRPDGEQGDQSTAVMAAVQEIAVARRAAGMLAGALGRAQNATSGLYLNDAGSER